MRQVRWNSTASTPPLMATLRADLKTAMRAKDTARYDYLFILEDRQVLELLLTIPGSMSSVH